MQINNILWLGKNTYQYQGSLGSNRRLTLVNQNPPPDALVLVNVGAVNRLGLFWNFLVAPTSTSLRPQWKEWKQMHLVDDLILSFRMVPYANTLHLGNHNRKIKTYSISIVSRNHICFDGLPPISLIFFKPTASIFLAWLGNGPWMLFWVWQWTPWMKRWERHSTPQPRSCASTRSRIWTENGPKR